MVILIVCVDDILCCGDLEMIESMNQRLKGMEGQLELRTEGSLEDYIGCRIHVDEDKCIIAKPVIIRKFKKSLKKEIKDLKNKYIQMKTKIQLKIEA